MKNKNGKIENISGEDEMYVFVPDDIVNRLAKVLEKLGESQRKFKKMEEAMIVKNGITGLTYNNGGDNRN